MLGDLTIIPVGARLADGGTMFRGCVRRVVATGGGGRRGAGALPRGGHGASAPVRWRRAGLRARAAAVARISD